MNGYGARWQIFCFGQYWAKIFYQAPNSRKSKFSKSFGLNIIPATIQTKGGVVCENLI